MRKLYFCKSNGSPETKLNSGGGEKLDNNQQFFVLGVGVTRCRYSSLSIVKPPGKIISPKYFKRNKILKMSIKIKKYKLKKNNIFNNYLHFSNFSNYAIFMGYAPPLAKMLRGIKAQFNFKPETHY